MPDLGQAFVQIVPSAKGISGAIEEVLGGEAEKAGKSAGGKIASGIGATLAAGTGVIASAVGTVASGLVSGVSDVAAFGDTIDKASQKLGISAEAYQEWDAVLQHSGTSMESMTVSFKTMANAIADPTKEQAAAFDKLGLSAEVYAMTTEDAFAAVISKLQEMPESAERTALAQDLLGRGAMELGALFNTSAEDTQAMIDRVHELGGVLSNEDVKAAAAFQDSMQDMQTAMQGVVRSLTTQFLPSFTGVMNGITEIASGNTETGISMLVDSLGEIGDKIISVLPSAVQGVEALAQQLLPTALSAASSLIDSVVSALPGMLNILANVAPQIITSLVTTIVQNVGPVIEAAVGIVTALASAIGDNLPMLIPMAVEAVTTLATSLTSPDTLSALLSAGLGILQGLASGIIEAIPVLVAALPEIVQNIIDFCLGAIPTLMDAGMQMLMGIVEAIPQIIPPLVAAIPQIVDSFVAFIIEGAPMLLEAGITLLMALIDAIPQIIPPLVEALPEIIDAICSGLLENLPALIDAGLQMFMALVEALPEIIVGLVDAAAQIVTALVNAFGEAIPQLWETGKQIVQGLWNGITEAWDWLVDNFKRLVDNLVGGVKEVLGIHSPSTIFEGIGENMALGLGAGWRDGIDGVERDIRNGLSFGGSEMGLAISSGYAGGGETFNITIDAASVREFNDIVDIAQNARRERRMATA